MITLDITDAEQEQLIINSKITDPIPVLCLRPLYIKSY